MSNKINTESCKNHLIQGISDFEELERLLLANGSMSHLYINTAAGEVRFFMISLLSYLEGRSPCYSSVFNEEFFISLLQLMHRACLSSLHISVEAALNEVIKLRKIKPKKLLSEQVTKIVTKIKSKLSYSYQSKIAKELLDIRKLGGNHIQFEDYLETVLENIVLFKDEKRDKDYKKGVRNFFKALSVVRNKQSHFINQSLTENEKNNLKIGGLGKLISTDGKLLMGINYYQPIFSQVFIFFNLIINRV